MSSEFADKSAVGKINIEEQKSLASKFNVRSIPTLILFENGKEVKRFVGIKQKDFLLKEINSYANNQLPFMNYSISNYYQYNSTIASGAQPSESDIEMLKNEGFEVILNISPTSARNALHNEASLTEKADMHYVHFPVDCSNLQPVHYMTFSGIMNGLRNKKIFVNCGGNIKSSNLIHMYDVLENRVDERESLKTLKKIQNPEAKWFDYFKSFGMEGVK